MSKFNLFSVDKYSNLFLFLSEQILNSNFNYNTIITSLYYKQVPVSFLSNVTDAQTDRITFTRSLLRVSSYFN